MKTRKFLLFFLFLSTINFEVEAQTSKVDNLRNTVLSLWYSDIEAEVEYPKFIRWAPNYYVGYMFQGIHKKRVAKDRRGYEIAIRSLGKAKKLIEKDYGKSLKYAYWNQKTYQKHKSEIIQRQRDYTYICSELYGCYSNIGQADSAYIVIDDLEKKQMVNFFYENPYQTKAWLYYRNRTKTSKDFFFLKTSIAENVAEAMNQLNKSFKHLEENEYVFDRVWVTSYFETKHKYIYYYKAIFHLYNLEIDSAEYCYKKHWSKISNNNYGISQLTKADFPTAEKYFNKDIKDIEKSKSKSLRESYIWLSMIDIYRGKPIEGIKQIEAIIDKQGIVPGYGWYNMGLSRVHYYAGNWYGAMNHIMKATEFNELHIGSTWTEEQYRFFTGLYMYIILKSGSKRLKFEDRNYYYSPANLVDISWLNTRAYWFYFQLTDALANNKERDQVLYRIFSSENMFLFDEIWTLIENYSPKYFIELFEDRMNYDPRSKVKKYYKYLSARFYMKLEEYQKALDLLESVLEDPELNKEYEKLLIARTHEAMAITASEMENQTKEDEHLLRFYQTYPELVPYSQLKMTFKLDIQESKIDSLQKYEKEIRETLEKFSINWLQPDDSSIFPTIQIWLNTHGKHKVVNLKVVSESNAVVIDTWRKKFSMSPNWKAVLYQAFNIDTRKIDFKNKKIDKP